MTLFEDISTRAMLCNVLYVLIRQCLYHFLGKRSKFIFQVNTIIVAAANLNAWVNAD